MSGFNSNFRTAVVKSGTGGGVSVIEAASYDALAVLAKTSDHGILMKDTSTGFYYKNWKTGGPGIPVPVRYFDDLTGYASNSGSKRSNCYFTLDDAYADFIGTTAQEDFTTGTPQGGFTLTKTAGNPLILNAPGSSTSSGFVQFQTSAAIDKCLLILKINSVTGTSNTRFKGSMIFPTANSSGTSQYTQRVNLSTPAAPSIKVVPNSGSGTTARNSGPDLPISAPEWFWFLSDATAADSLFINSDINSTSFHVVERDSGEQYTEQPRPALIFVSSNTSVGSQVLEISELHSFVF